MYFLNLCPPEPYILFFNPKLYEELVLILSYI